MKSSTQLLKRTLPVTGRALKLGERPSRWLVALSAAVVLGAAGYFVLRFLPTPTEMVVPDLNKQPLAIDVANDVGARLAGIGRQLDELAQDPGLAQLIGSADATRRRAAEQELREQLDHALRVRLLPPGFNQVDSSWPLSLGYACLEMIQTAEAEATPPRVEAHLFGNRQQHVDMARKVLHTDGTTSAGVLLVSFGVGLFQDLLADAGGIPGRVELRQGALTLASRGKLPGERTAAVPASIPGTRWQVMYWPDTGGAYARLIQVSIWTLPVLALLLGYLLVRPWLGKRRGAAASTAATVTGRPRRTAPEAEVMTDPMFQGEQAMGVEIVNTGASANVPESIFRAYDIRGVVGDTLTSEVVSAIGQALGSEAYERGQQTLVVARDGRLSGPELTQALIAGLQASGRDVVDIGMVPTPVLYFATRHLKTGSGVMVTGSHNPPDYNGFKMMLGNETLSGEAIQSLRQRIVSGDLLTGTGTLNTADVVEDYINYIAGDVLLIKPFRVVVDCGNGVAGSVAPRLLRELGCEVTELYCEVDGHFPNHHPDPAKPENLKALVAAVKEQGADLGFAFDGDGDRLGVIASDGQIIWPDRLLMVYARDLLSRHRGAEIIYDVKCSRNLARVIADHGGKPVMCRTGHAFMKAKLNKSPALLAGEMSGHIFFKERYFGFDDALYAAARLLEALVQLVDSRSTADVFAELPDAVNTPELNVPMGKEGENFRFMEQLLESAEFPDGAVTTIDGLRVDFSDSWGLVRASNTTPSLALRFEAQDAGGLNTIQQQFKEQMLKVKPDLELPF